MGENKKNGMEISHFPTPRNELTNLTNIDKAIARDLHLCQILHPEDLLDTDRYQITMNCAEYQT